jgi:hypothetical protein
MKMDDLSAPQPSGSELTEPVKKKKPKAVKKVRKPKRAATKKAVKKVRKPKRAATKKKVSSAVAERLDLRLPRSVKIKLLAKAKKTRRTITSIVLELLEKSK